jgi:acetyltransferase-like isoleucine patch superfamily enzyme
VLNTKCSVDHDCFIDDYASISPGATIGGNVSIGSYSVIALGANVIHAKKIGQHSIIGAGSTVINDIGSHVIAYGTPAKVVRNRIQGEKYL